MLALPPPASSRACRHESRLALTEHGRDSLWTSRTTSTLDPISRYFANSCLAASSAFAAFERARLRCLGWRTNIVAQNATKTHQTTALLASPCAVLATANASVATANRGKTQNRSLSRSC